jgi:hypothetical protein
VETEVVPALEQRKQAVRFRIECGGLYARNFEYHRGKRKKNKWKRKIMRKTDKQVKRDNDKKSNYMDQKRNTGT